MLSSTSPHAQQGSSISSICTWLFPGVVAAQAFDCCVTSMKNCSLHLYDLALDENKRLGKLDIITKLWYEQMARHMKMMSTVSWNPSVIFYHLHGKRTHSCMPRMSWMALDNMCTWSRRPMLKWQAVSSFQRTTTRHLFFIILFLKYILYLLCCSFLVAELHFVLTSFLYLRFIRIATVHYKLLMVSIMLYH